MGALMFVINLLLGVSYLNIIIYGLAGALFFFLQYVLTNKKGVGEGDIWFGLFLGISFPSASSLVLVLLVAYCFGTLISLALMAVHKKGLKSKIALGPFLALGALVTLLYGSAIINWYFGLGGIV